MDRSLSPLAGAIAVSSAGGLFPLAKREFTAQEGVHETKFNAELGAGIGGSVNADVVALQYDTSGMQLRRERVLFPVNSAQLVESVTREDRDGKLVYRCGNGVIAIESAPAFGSAVHSMAYLGEEWLDTSYPTPGPRSWWNPWTGGLHTGLEGISPYSLMQESRSAKFTMLTDSKGNRWNGMELGLRIEEHEKLRGLELSQYYVMLPGAPVLCAVTRIHNGTGIAHLEYRVTSQAFLRPAGTLDQAWMEGPDSVKYRCGVVSHEIKTEGVARLGSEERKMMLHVVARQPEIRSELYTNNHVLEHAAEERLRLLTGADVWRRPVFYVFADRRLTEEMLRDLGELTFTGGV